MGYNLNYFIFNNYVNRRVKRYETIEGYISAPGAQQIYVQDDVAFSEADGVTTYQVCDTEQFGTRRANYVIVTDQSNAILSRWFVVESDYLRINQVRMTFYRDLTADYLEEWLNAPAFIQKASLNMLDPLIFNEEEMTFNQIKKKEKLLAEPGKCAWLCGYVAKNLPEINGSFTDDVSVPVVDGIENWTYYKYSNLAPQKDFYHVLKNGRFTFKYYLRWFNQMVGSRTKTYAASNGVMIDAQNGAYEPSISIAPQDEGITNTMFEGKDYRGSIINSFPQLHEEPLDPKQTEIKDSKTGIYYQITVEKIASDSTKIDITPNKALIYTELINQVNATGKFSTPTDKSKLFQLEYNYDSYQIVLTQAFPSTTQYYQLPTSHKKTVDAVYDMFAIPYGTVRLVDGSMPGAIIDTKVNALSWVNDIMLKQDQQVYDVQLLPYCPIDNALIRYSDVEGILHFDLPSLQEVVKKEYSLLHLKEKPDGIADITGILLWAERSKFKRVIEEQIPLTAKTPSDLKVEALTKKVRMCSPNWASIFEFVPAKNYGVSRFNIDCHYKPYTPYIHIAPEWNGLYGSNFGDARGLILQGEFSVSRITSAWERYELEHKNYQASFDRKIESMELQNKYQKIGDVIGAISGAGVSTAVGGTLGGVGGAIAGGVTGAVGGVVDVMVNDILRKDNLDLTKDQFGYELGNIKALPYTLSNVSTFNPNNKIFPVLEFYEATPEEEDALRQKIKYNGMTVMKVGQVKNYLRDNETFIKATLIQIPDISDDFHIASVLKSELERGVYISNEYTGKINSSDFVINRHWTASTSRTSKAGAEKRRNRTG